MMIAVGTPFHNPGIVTLLMKYFHNWSLAFPPTFPAKPGNVWAGQGSSEGLDRDPMRSTATCSVLARAWQLPTAKAAQMSSCLKPRAGFADLVASILKICSVALMSPCRESCIKRGMRTPWCSRLNHSHRDRFIKCRPMTTGAPECFAADPKIYWISTYYVSAEFCLFICIILHTLHITSSYFEMSIHIFLYSI